MARIRRFESAGRLNSEVEANHLYRRGVMVGTDPRSPRIKSYLPLGWLWTHFHAIGPTGSGKSRWLAWLVQVLAQVRNSTTIVLDPKGDLYDLLCRWIAGTRLPNRTILFDPGGDRILGYNPLRPNGLPIETHARAVREGITAAWGQGADFDQTPQLARFLYYALAVARELELTIAEALQVLYPSSPLRRILVPRLRSPYLRQALSAFDALPERRQEELVASSLARLEPFVVDPTIARIFTQQERGIDVHDIVNQPHLLLIKLKLGSLREADRKLVGRILLNDIVAHAFQRSDPSHHIFLIVDEVQEVATRDFCAALDQGRGLGLHVIAAHQHLHQLRDEEKSGYLYHSVMADARTKVVFGGLAVDDLRVLAEECFLGEFDPKRIKDELTTLELEPFESRREIVTRADSDTWSATAGSSSSVGSTRSAIRGKSVGISRQRGQSRGRAHAVSSGSGQANGASLSIGEVVLPCGNMVQTGHEGHAEFDSSFVSESDIESTATHNAFGRHRSVNRQESRGTTTLSGTSQMESTGGGTSTSRSTVPFYEYRKRRVVSSRTFVSWEEFLLERMQELQRLPRGTFLVKGPEESGQLLRAPFVADRKPLRSQRIRAEAHIYAKPIYSTAAEVDAEEQVRRRRLATLVRLPDLRNLKSVTNDEEERIITQGSRRKRQRQS